MRVGIDIGGIRGTGSIWKYRKTLASKLADACGVTLFLLYADTEPTTHDGSVETIKYPYSGPVPRWDRSIQGLDLDIVHLSGLTPYHILPSLRVDAQVVTTVHGSFHNRWSEYIPHAQLHRHAEQYYPWYLERIFQVLEAASAISYDRIFTISDWVSNALVEIADFDSGQVVTVHEAIDDIFYSKAPERYDNTPSKYILHVSYSGPRKNVHTLINSLSILRSRNTDVNLIIAGKGWKNQAHMQVHHLGLNKYVTFAGYVNKSYLINLYDNALAFAFPSLYEGFGLPNIEAMSRGTPVISANRAAIPEVVGNAALLIDNPLDEYALADAIERVITNDETTAALRSRGLNRAQNFRWEIHTADIIEQYRTLLA